MRAMSVLAGVALLVVACGTGASSAPGAGATASAPAAVELAATQAAGANASTGDKTALGEKRSEAGGVAIVATWSSSDPPVIALTLDTHSVDLDRADPASAVKLRLDGGAWVVPSGADVPKGGHHRSGTLTFGTVSPSAFAAATLIELHIADIGVPERLLLWQRAG